ncbi:MAG: endonuclease [Planctomycetes bacterium HGW-Planctomycetes-1]|nr:MAG: endonuclease [Planctomycetes bacterium HGW-Planctomycetes-1]
MNVRQNMLYYVYILLNETGTRTYTGVSNNVNERLKEHNAGRVSSSRPYRPYKIIHMESFPTLQEARQKEKFYKSTTGRRRLRELFFKVNVQRI